ncbi:MAG: DUF5340 domain-containing protein [Pegethrix bostrychoides GSE-TBD4-15B]|jgi:hypothetical protein|uniref:DUF5340 domain-containing protein n=1 Tax=Pegethrix bostrychoides GSE-TBD4-15B TaxID=2839662 RepID=A0A951U6R8_9CYAN|nr:DUF5340 domain-containing protein [Pegethrix bostrychoides GSE-TBD4-15B]
MDPIPLPSHIHYELLLQLLERQTIHAIGRKSPQQEQLHELISTLRKAFTQQKQLEESCERAHLAVDYRWSLNQRQQPGEQNLAAVEANLTAQRPAKE